MKSLINSISRMGYNRSFGIMIIRVAVGLVFFLHGWAKLGGLAGVEMMFVGFGLPAWVGIFIAWLETLGGLALILGVATRFFGIVFAIEMLVAVYLTGTLTNPRGPDDLILILMLTSLGIAFAGSGRLSLFKLECEECGAMLCDVHGKKRA